MRRFVTEFLVTLENSRSLQHRLLLAFIVLLGFALRFHAWWFGQGYHFFSYGDELNAYEYGMQYLAGEEHAQYLAQPTFGMGRVPGLLWTWTWVALYKLGGNTLLGAAFWMMCLTSTATIFMYWLARQFFSPRMSLLGAFLFATAPWAIYYSVGTWNPYPMVLLGAGLFLASWRVASTERSRAVFLACVFAAAIPQYHMIGVFYAPVLLLLFILRWRELNYSWLAAGIVVGIAFYVRYLIGDAAHGWQNLHLMLSADAPFSFSVAKVISGPITTLSNMTGNWAGYGYEAFAEFGDWLMWDHRLLLVVSLSSAVLALFYVGSHLRSFYTALKQQRFSLFAALRQSPMLTFTGIFLYLPLILFLLTGHNYATRYAILILPLLFLLPLFVLQKHPLGWVGRWLPRLMVATTVFNLYIVVGFYIYQGKQITDGKEFMPCQSCLVSLGEALRKDAGAGKWREISLDQSATTLPEERQKMAFDINYYLTVFQQYVEHVVPDKANAVKYRYALLGDNTCKVDLCVYQSHDIAIVRDR